MQYICVFYQNFILFSLFLSSSMAVTACVQCSSCPVEVDWISHTSGVIALVAVVDELLPVQTAPLMGFPHLVHLYIHYFTEYGRVYLGVGD